MKTVKSVVLVLGLLLVGFGAFADEYSEKSAERYDVFFRGYKSGVGYQACAEEYTEYALSEDNGVEMITFYVPYSLSKEDMDRLNKKADVVAVGENYVTYGYESGSEGLVVCAHCRF